MNNFLIKRLFFIFFFSSVLVFAQSSPTEIPDYNIIRTSAEKYKISIIIMLEPAGCEICISHINPLYNTKYKNLDVDMKMYFHTAESQIMEKAIKDYNWKLEVIQDPMNLYAKHFNIDISPAIVILDENGEVLHNSYLGSGLYRNVLNKIDSLAEKITPIETGAYKITKTIPLTKDNKKHITDQLQVCYDSYKNNYLLIEAKDKKILIFDSLGEYYREVKFPYKEYFKYNYPWQIEQLNDSIIYFVDWPLTGGNYFIKMNINTGDTLSVFNLDIYPNRKSDTAGFYVNDYCYNKVNNNIIFQYNSKVIEIAVGTPLLLLVDLNKNTFEQFAPSTKRLSKSDTRTLNSNRPFINYSDNTINHIIRNTKIINVFDEKGKHLKNIDLDVSNNFKHSFQIDIELGSEKYTQQLRKIFDNSSYIDIADIINDTINIFYHNSHGPDLRDYYYERFDKNGKRIGESIKFATNERPIYFKDNTLITTAGTSDKTIKWYEFK